MVLDIMGLIRMPSLGLGVLGLITSLSTSTDTSTSTSPVTRHELVLLCDGIVCELNYSVLQCYRCGSQLANAYCQELEILGKT